MNKEKIIQACKDAEACKGEFKKLTQAKNDEEFIAILKDNLWWVFEELPYEVIKEIDFDWKEFDRIDWVDLLTNHPQFSTYCDWDKLNGFDLTWLLINREGFSIYCDWEKLNGYAWADLLVEQPQFHIHCDWSKLDNKDWKLLLQFQPQFIKYRK